MSRDHKPRPVHSAPRNSGGTLLGVFIGLVIGVVIAFGLVWYLNKAPLPFQDKVSHNDSALPTEATPGQPPQSLPPKPGDKVQDKPRFEFYKILPDGQDAASASPAPAPGEPAKTAPPVEALYLQVGAFQKSSDADNLKAKLALMGVEANVQEVSNAEKGTLNRVRVGPFKTPEEMNRVRNQLSQNDIPATVSRAAIPAPDAKVEPKAADKTAKPAKP
ncbi:MAG: SPOR domain-containing protein [Proteobacteria bacterium]|nr:SPOR domain-containing protein [Pseudomonadota bacterium]HQR04118.1 SPOR domain-containing protein [Rhodocyclaceae bacterium]